MALALLIILAAGFFNSLAAQCKADGGVITVSKSTSCDEIKKGIAIAHDGQVVKVLLGTYPENISITNGIKVVGEISKNAKGEIIRPVIVSQSEVVVRITGNNITLEGFEIRNVKPGEQLLEITKEEEKHGIGRTGILVEPNSSQVTIANNKITKIGYRYRSSSEYHQEQALGINVKSYGGMGKITVVAITGNELSELNLGQSEAIAINGDVETFTIENNRIHDVDNIAIDIGGFQEECPQHSGTPCREQAQSGKIIGNKVWNLTPGNPGQKEVGGFIAGIYIDGGKDTVILGNQVFNFGIGVSIGSEYIGKSVSEIEISNNLIYENKIVGILIGKGDEQSSYVSNCVVNHNTIQNNGSKDNDGGQIRLESYLPNALQNIQIEDNLILLTESETHRVLLFVENCLPKNDKCNPQKILTGVTLNHNYFFASEYDEAWYFKGINGITNQTIVSYFEKDKFLNNKLGIISFPK